MAVGREEFTARAEADGIEFFFAMFVDMHGKPCAKLIPAASIDLMLDGGAGFAGFAAGPLGQTPADPDIIGMPDLSSYTPVPWQPGLAVVQCDPHVDGEPWPYAPRVILKRALARLAERGMTYMTGVEAEYMLVRRTAAGGIELADPLDTASAPCYDVKALTRMFPFLTTVSRHMNSLGWTNYANDHEDGNGQFEQNFAYADALTTADRLIFFRYMVHTLAHEAGMAATFMPKPFANLTGNGLHVHSSLWDDGGGELFADEADPRGLGLSPLAYQFAAGLIQHASAATAVTCPTVNSYKRMGVGAPTSGATWAPAYATYGGNNRTQMLRIPEGGRIENRGCDGSANPYLAFSVMLASGLDGIDRSLDPGEPNVDNLFQVDAATVAARGIEAMPPTLLHAVERLTEDDVLREALGRCPDRDYIDYFAEIKRAEFGAYHAAVSGWEIERYLTLY
ncbi:MAG: type III glutamate--ammonia ligase [Geodermatophilaceae bacterium]|nr:type III glutamate--ammonia ligase [Geodermatophilaceae bacterium]MDQ3465274.1 type III glutamate--ammonia ligase [Actinomycetota bacterium]